MKSMRLIVALLILLAVALPASAAPANQGSLKIKKIDKSGYPEIKLHLGLATVDKNAAFMIKEDGKEIKNLEVSSQTNKQPVAVTLIIDVSGSMEGKPLDDAKSAAGLFIDRARPGDRIAVVAFSSTVNRVADFTDDKQKLNQAISGLSAQGETAVYDALIDSLRAATRNSAIANQSMILLSDGGDTASAKSDGEAAALAGELKIPVSVVTLESAEFNPEPVAAVAQRSGGHVLTAASSDVLAGLYDGLAAELHNRYQVTYKSQTKKTRAKLEVEARADSEVIRTSGILTGLPGAPKAAPKPARVQSPIRLSDTAVPWVAAVLGFAAAFLAVLALAHLLLPSQNTLSKQLKYYDQLQGRKTADRTEPFFDRVRQSAVKFAGDVSAKYNFSAYSDRKLEQAGLPVRSNDYMVMHVLAVISVALAALLLTGSMFIAVLIVAAAVAGPLLAIEVLIERRKSAFNDQLPDTLDLLAGSMRAGYGLQQAVAAASREAREPTASELARVCTQVQMGMSIEEALGKMSDRLANPAFRWVVLAIAIHRETGGNLAEILDSLSDSLRQRESMRRQIKALTAEGRLSAVILIALPFLEGAMLAVLNPAYMSMLVTSLPGILMLLLALTLMAGGAAWLRSITNIDY